MSYTTKIGWTASLMPDGEIIPGATWNPWIGCTKVSQGCKFCYAETQNARYKWNRAGWGPGAPRKRTGDANWRKPYAWAKEACISGVSRKVFGGSLCDPFDSEVPSEWRSDYWELMRHCDELKYDVCPHRRNVENFHPLQWLLLTKRPENMYGMLPKAWVDDDAPGYVRIGVSVEDENNTRRVTRLLDNWHGKNFISCEPLLGAVSIPLMGWIDWVIAGGESGTGYRELNIAHLEGLYGQCNTVGVPFYCKQDSGRFPGQQGRIPDRLWVHEFPED